MSIHSLYRPFLKFFRTKRMRRFWHRFGVSPTTYVLDIGGDPFNWSLLCEQPRLVIVNLYTRGKGNWVVADARHLPFKGHAFDIAYSNSVIEHLGSFEDQLLFASECRRVSKSYYVQTPNRRFPIEPHLITPFIHWLPPQVQRRLLRNFTVWGLITRPTQGERDQFMKEIRLLDEEDLEELFPDARIWHERFLGLKKSLIAVKGASRGCGHTVNACPCASGHMAPVNVVETTLDWSALRDENRS